VLFNSDIFLFVFLPVVLIGFYLLGKFKRSTAALLWLVLGSLVFYGWWNPAYLVLLGISVVTNYSIGALLIKQRGTSAAKLVVSLGVIFNLGLLGYFKYANFFISITNTLTGWSSSIDEIVLPLAISFFTFQQIAYLVDVYQDKAEEYSFLHYCLFVTFFPQLIAGPIVHHKEMMPQFMKQETYRFIPENLAVGISIFMLGLFKKMIFADSVAVYATPVFAAADGGASIGFFEAWTGSLCYTLQIYFDFSGYSDMAIGLGRMFGIRLPLNFNSPYKALSIVDFWRRWHMTLSRFLRDYLYIPLGGNRYGDARRYTNLMTVMLIGGLWHGAGWTFVAWGGLHGFYLLVNHAWRASVGERFRGSVARLCYWCLTFLAVVVAWVFFRAETFGGAVEILFAMAGGNGVTVPGWMPHTPGFNQLARLLQLESTRSLMATKDAFIWIAALLPVAFILPNTQQIMSRYMQGFDYRIESVANRLAGLMSFRPGFVSAAVIALVSIVAITSLWKTSEFLYYQF